VTVKDSHVTAGGIWAQEIGSGPLVVLVHGSMDRSGGMLRVRRDLQGDHAVIRYDRRGYARSLPAGPPTSFDQQVDDLADVLGGRPAVLVGHSFGGLVGLALAERRPGLVRAVVAYEAPYLWAPWWPGGTAGAAALAAGGDGLHADDAAEAFLRRMIGDENWERLPQAMRAERRAEGATLVAELLSVRPPRPAPFDARAIAAPVISARGSLARPQHVRASEELARTAPRGELVVVPGAEHGAHLTHPHAVADLARRAEVLAGTPGAAG
jgi:pimeloyl-ACP methyl ester carboxylesterase